MYWRLAKSWYILLTKLLLIILWSFNYLSLSLIIISNSNKTITVKKSISLSVITDKSNIKNKSFKQRIWDEMMPYKEKFWRNLTNYKVLSLNLVNKLKVQRRVFRLSVIGTSSLLGSLSQSDCFFFLTSIQKNQGDEFWNKIFEAWKSFVDIFFGVSPILNGFLFLRFLWNLLFSKYVYTSVSKK